VGCGDLGLVWIGLGDAGVDLVPIANPEQGLPHNRYNDGKMGPDGRYWAGTMHEAEMDATGTLYAFRPDGGWSVLDRGYVIANGPAFSGDGTIVYHADSAARTIYAFDLCANGALAGKRTFVRFEEGDGFPDGMSVDDDGNLWVAMWDGGRLEMIEPTGARRGIVELPIQRPTSCVFAEPDGQQLFVTSARRGVQGDEPAPGGLFSVRLR
jgi:sugar lactone lactonase YvrE